MSSQTTPEELQNTVTQLENEKINYLLAGNKIDGMNESETKQLVDDIRLIRNQVSSILLIEHDMDLIQQLSDRVVAMDYGRKIAEGIASDVLRHPDVVRAYLGEDVEQVVR